MAFPLHSRLTRRSALQWVGATGLTVVGLPATVSRAALDTIHVAVVVDTSGAGAVYGAPVLNGMLLAATEINARGGVNGHALDLTVSDGRSDLARVTALVRRACQDTTTVALVGPTPSRPRGPMPSWSRPWPRMPCASSRSASRSACRPASRSSAPTA